MKAVIALLLLCAPALAQHQHPPQDMALHEAFYQNWNVPNGGNPRVRSCCNKTDCAPAEIRRDRGRWLGRRLQDTNWTEIPDTLIESNQGDPRESPDGASHLCVSASGTALCAVLGAGG